MTDWADQTEERMLEAALSFAPEMGWGPAMVDRAARRVGLSRAETELLLPNGPRDLAALLSRRHDRLPMERLGQIDPATLKIREKIARGVETRLYRARAMLRAAVAALRREALLL